MRKIAEQIPGASGAEVKVSVLCLWDAYGLRLVFF